MKRIYKYYAKNLGRFAHLVRSGEFQKIFLPSRFSSEQANNLEVLGMFLQSHFGGHLANITTAM